jgi:hypothetical protein
MRSAQSGCDAIILKFAPPQSANEAHGVKRVDCLSAEAKIEFDDKVP